ncbi:hypothetical protein [Thermogutta sp.]|uniref:hypothetical protein n=1 Tax=Thermogutta sp. TaxID=1962930 RepID=UPI00321FEAD1
MRKTAFSTAVFGLCSSALLLIGLSSLREPLPVLAQNRSSETSVPATETLSYESEWEESVLASHQDVAANDPFNGAWDTGPVPDDALAAQESASSAPSIDPTSGYRYYYRFTPDHKDFVRIEDSDGWREKHNDPDKAEFASSDDSLSGNPDKPAEPTLPSDAKQGSETLQYSFVDEYSSEEAARYEMAQENRSQASYSGTLELAEDGYFPWYEKYYYLMSSQEHVGTRPNQCRVNEEKTAEPTPAPATADSGDATSGPGYSFDGRTWEPDYEADVAAAWLFAASRNLTAGGEAAERQLAEMSNSRSLEEMDSLPDEAYEEWDVYSETTDPDWEVMSDDEGLMPSENNPQRHAEVESSENGMPGEEGGFSPDAMDDAGEYDSYDEAMEDDAPNVPEEPAAPEDETTWTIVNPEPIVSSSAESDRGYSSTSLIFDTPWHGEPGENFLWVESESAPDSPAAVDQSAESDDMDSSYGWNSDDWDSGSLWDMDVPGYRTSDEARAVGENRDVQIEDQNNLEGTSDPAGESSEGGDFRGEEQEETPAEAGSIPWDEAIDEPLPDATYTGDYLEGSYEWEEPTVQENGREMDVAAPVGASAVPAENEGVSLGRVLRGLAAATLGVLPRLTLRDFSLGIPTNMQ